jgi:hypothetical protein
MIGKWIVTGAVVVGITGAMLHAQSAATVKAQIKPGITPAWEKGIQPITPESYYQAIECGKQSGTPACVFWDNGLCKNADFALAMYTPYKMVAYEVWNAVSRKQPAPQPNYAEAQQTRITIGVTPERGAKNVLSDLVLERGGKPVVPRARSITAASSRFTFDFPAFAPTSAVTLKLVGKERTISCTIDAATLRRMR